MSHGNTRFIAYDPTASERIDGINAGIHALVLGVGDTATSALHEAHKYLGVHADGLAIGKTTDADVRQGEHATRHGKTGTLFTSQKWG